MKNIGHSKTLVKRVKREFVTPKVVTDAVRISFSQFVTKIQGNFGECYKITNKLGEGK